MKKFRLFVLRHRLNFWRKRLRDADLNYAMAVFDVNHSNQPHSVIKKAAQRYSAVQERIRRLEVRHDAILRT